MRRGGIAGGGRLAWPLDQSLEWVTDGNEGPDSGLEERVPLTSSIFFPEEADAYYCPDCRQVTIPVPETEPVTQKLRRAVEAAGDKLDELQQDLADRMEEKKEEKKWKRRRGKDPWEW